MSYELAKVTPVTLRQAGKDERWLQDVIVKDPAILNLGDLSVIHRELSIPRGGRIDLILSDTEAEDGLRYEVEIMLGKVDESHIIRTIEYWDIERRRYPSYQHRAVIIAEEITNRFFNVISLLNKAVPIIAIQLDAFTVGGQLALNFVKVLDLAEEEAPDGGEQVDRKHWEQTKKPALAVIDAVTLLFPKQTELRAKYNQGHVAVGTTGTNFAWFLPRKGEQVVLEVTTGEDVRDDFIRQLSEKGIDARPHRSPCTLKAKLRKQDVEAQKELLKLILAKAEAYSRE